MYKRDIFGPLSLTSILSTSHNINVWEILEEWIVSSNLAPISPYYTTHNCSWRVILVLLWVWKGLRFSFQKLSSLGLLFVCLFVCLFICLVFLGIWRGTKLCTRLHNHTATWKWATQACQIWESTDSLGEHAVGSRMWEASGKVETEKIWPYTHKPNVSIIQSSPNQIKYINLFMLEFLTP